MTRTFLACACLVWLGAAFGCGDDASTGSDGGSDGGSSAGTDGGSTAHDGGAPGNSGDDAGSSSGQPAVEDPLPGKNEPGEYGCDGCPSSDSITDFEPDFGNATFNSFDGTVTGAQGDGTFYVRGANGATFGGPIQTGEAGDYHVSVPLLCGEQTVKLVWNNKTGLYGVVLAAKTTDCIDADIRVTLSWDDLGYDFEAHLIKEGGHINDRTNDRFVSNDCTWTTCLSGEADWGKEGDPSDNPHKDVDNTGNYGPENIYYAKPETGTYTVMVEHWGAGMPTADGNVIINVRGKPTVAIPITDLAPHWVFTAATIDWPSGAIKKIASQFDCTGSWSGGCTAAIP